MYFITLEVINNIKFQMKIRNQKLDNRRYTSRISSSSTKGEKRTTDQLNMILNYTRRKKMTNGY